LVVGMRGQQQSVSGGQSTCPCRVLALFNLTDRCDEHSPIGAAALHVAR